MPVWPIQNPFKSFLGERGKVRGSDELVRARMCWERALLGLECRAGTLKMTWKKQCLSWRLRAGTGSTGGGRDAHVDGRLGRRATEAVCGEA